MYHFPFLSLHLLSIYVDAKSENKSTVNLQTRGKTLKPTKIKQQNQRTN